MASQDPEAGNQVIRRDIYSVSRLNREVRVLLEQGFARVWLEGELSNIARPSSGHLYFTLKDARAQIRAAMFRNRSQSLRFTPEEGMQALVRARVSLYEPRGDYQLIVDHMEEAGDGALRRAFEELKQKLASESLFAPENKQPLPTLPQRIGVITSPSGAAIRDVLSVLRRRFPAIPVLVYPVPVQGKDAAAMIADTIHLASDRGDCDVLILTRGGGSLEDLWSFNEEVVARAVHACRIPLVCAVGHEIDYTIADFVADQRAPTPSAAAELVSPDQLEWLAQLNTLAGRLENRLRQRLHLGGQRAGWLEKRLQQLHPGQYLRQQSQRLDQLEQRSRFIVNRYISDLQSELNEVSGQLKRLSPVQAIARQRLHQDNLGLRLGSAMQRLLSDKQRRLGLSSRALDTISPLATLERGYAIVSRLPERHILRQASKVKPGDRIEARLSEGVLVCSVEQTQDPP
jgi:exodeoxyribonuclease VII large subunit